MSIKTLQDMIGRGHFTSLTVCLEWDGLSDTIQPFVRNPPHPILTRLEWEGIKSMVDDWYAQVSDGAITKYNHEADAAYLRQVMDNATKSYGNTEPEAGWIYVLSGGGYYKIGKTVDLERRLTRLVLPFEVELVCTITSQDITATEKELHERFADKRINGEWFTLDDADLDWIMHYGNH